MGRSRTFTTPKHRVPRRTFNDGLQPHPPRPTPRGNTGLTSAAQPGRRPGTSVAPVDADQPTGGAARRQTPFSASSATISEPVGPRRPGFDRRHPLGTPVAWTKFKKCARKILTPKSPPIAFFATRLSQAGAQLTRQHPHRSSTPPDVFPDDSKGRGPRSRRTVRTPASSAANRLLPVSRECGGAATRTDR